MFDVVDIFRLPQLAPIISSYRPTNHYSITSCLRVNIEHVYETGHQSSSFPPTPLTAIESPSKKNPHSFPTCHMTDRSGSSRFQALLESAVQAYEEKAAPH